MKWPTYPLSKVATDLQPGFARQPEAGRASLQQLRTNNVSPEGRIDLTLVKEVAASSGECNRYSLQKGDILFNNTNSAALVGKTAFFDIDGGPFLFSNHMTRVRVNKEIADPRFIARYLFWTWKTGGFRMLVTRWVNQAAINKTMLGGVKVPLPALSEQRRVVEILDHADQLRQKRAEADAKAARILPALFCKMFGDPATWELSGSTEPLGKLVYLQSGGTPSKGNPNYWDGDIPWISPKDMKRNFIDDAQDHITQLALDETNIRLVPIDAILIVVRGMILARCIPVAVNVKPITINQDMKALIVKDLRLSPLYLFAAMKALSQRLHASVGTAAHGTRKLDTDLLLSLPILIPDKQKHSAFVSWFMQFSKCNERRIQAGQRVERLFEVLLHRAFTGDLTTEWRDEHLKDLLAEMEAQAKSLEISHKP
jgi:type I restriction enzyme S subunit